MRVLMLSIDHFSFLAVLCCHLLHRCKAENKFDWGENTIRSTSLRIPSREEQQETSSSTLPLADRQRKLGLIHENNALLLPRGMLCVPGDEITSLWKCANYGLEVGGIFRDGANVVTGFWGHTPCGCFLAEDNAIHLNSNANCYIDEPDSRYAPVCEVNSLYTNLESATLFPQGSVCPQGDQVLTKEHCYYLGVHLGGMTDPNMRGPAYWPEVRLTDGSDPKDAPCGCYLYSNIYPQNTIHFNNAKDCGADTSGYGFYPICLTRPSAPHHVLQSFCADGTEMTSLEECEVVASKNGCTYVTEVLNGEYFGYECSIRSDGRCFFSSRLDVLQNNDLFPLCYTRFQEVSIALTADPQFYYLECSRQEGCLPELKENSDKSDAEKEHFLRKSTEEMIFQFSKDRYPRGYHALFINGDLIHGYNHEEHEVGTFLDYFVHNDEVLQMQVLFGLGNHDYANEGLANDSIGRILRTSYDIFTGLSSMKVIRDLDLSRTLDSNFFRDQYKYTGSWSFAYDIAGWTFLFIHNGANTNYPYPGEWLEIEKKDVIHATWTTKQQDHIFDFGSPKEWLESQVFTAEINSRKPMVMVHSCFALQAIYENDPEGNAFLGDVAAFFSGHIHHLHGKVSTIADRPCYYIGSTFFKTYSEIKLYSDGQFQYNPKRYGFDYSGALYAAPYFHHANGSFTQVSPNFPPPLPPISTPYPTNAPSSTLAATSIPPSVIIRCENCPHEWYDSEYKGCEYYENYPFLCLLEQDVSNFGKSPTEVCCVCGGGILYDECTEHIPAPTLAPVAPTLAPLAPSPSPLVFPTTPVPAPCYSSLTNTLVKGQGVVAIKDIHVGNEVLTGSGKFQKIYAMDHYHESRPTEFLQIHVTVTNDTTPQEWFPSFLEVTPLHMIFIEGQANPVPASLLKIGDWIQTIDCAVSKSRKEDHRFCEISFRKISNIATVVRKGFYNVLTADGTIVVNGIVGSTYSALLGTEYIEIGGFKWMSLHAFFHMALYPIRAVCLNDMFSHAMPGFCGVNAKKMNKQAHCVEGEYIAWYSYMANILSNCWNNNLKDPIAQQFLVAVLISWFMFVVYILSLLLALIVVDDECIRDSDAC